MLEDDVMSLQKEVEHLERVRDRFEHELTKCQSKLDLSESTLKKL